MRDPEKRPADEPDTGPPTEYRKIHERHVPVLVAAGISPAVADQTVISQNGSLLFNNRRPDGSRFTVERPDAPPVNPETGKPLFKYKHPPGGRGLNVHPSVRDRMTDVKAPLVMAEGTKQYLAVVSAAQSMNVFPVGMSGIRNWQWKPGGENTPSVPLPDWGYIPLKGRKAYVIPDGDYATNDDVRAATDALMDALRGMGASAVHRVAIPLGPDGKTGADDHLGAFPEAERTAELLRMIRESEDDSDDFFLTRDQLAELPRVEPLIKGMLNRSCITWLSGKHGTYKTFVALAWACSVATGRAWEGHTVAHPGPVIYVAAEGLYGLNGRTDAWEAAFNRGQRVSNLIVPRKGMDPRKPEDMAKLIRMAKKVGAVMIVFDTLHQCTPGMDENSAKEQGVAFDGFKRVRHETGCTVLVLAHTGYAGERARGSSAQEDDTDDAYVIKLDGEDRGPENPRTLIRKKSKEGESGGRFPLALVQIPGPDPFDPGEGSTAYIRLGETGGAAPKKETNVQRIIREMDDAGLPVELSQRGAAGWLAAREIDIKGRTKDWNTAHSARKERPLPSPGLRPREAGEAGGASQVLPEKGSS
ncbi:AAA family ATPase [Streptomyces sp. ActVer]|uniref:AAA family ATPase n=1 Tax=Streptomyces sp. ActVer TaxID=3014558 RepID=UPI0022B4BC53|nr:AAA family ATPase [Streptomyces sp. ActVer]MCZ4509799.1 AAA family ATPase [Streptomyces sp. ActVer]